MSLRTVTATIVSLLWLVTSTATHACCAVVGVRGHVVNADQSVIMIWDKKSQTQHFIRKADFKTDSDDIGFIVPSPSRPQLDESGDKAFDQLAYITAPMTLSGGGGFACGCSASAPTLSRNHVKVIEEKRVAGFDATVLRASSGKALVDWLEKNGYPYSPAIEAWAKPYLTGDWHFTALKVVKNPKAKAEAALKAASLRITFKTKRPLFPYREPDSSASSGSLNAQKRLLRIYFISDTQYEGKINGSQTWSGKAVWSGPIAWERENLLRTLQLPTDTGPQRWWLTEFEDPWPYEKAVGDVYFSPVDKPMRFTRNSSPRPVQLDASLFIILALGCLLKFRKHP